MRYLLSLLLILSTIGLADAQTENPMAPGYAELNYSEKKSYFIAKINIVGAERRDDNAIKSITKLREGEQIEIPGPALTKSIESLMRLRLFSEVEILMDKIVGDSIYLTIQLQEQPILAGYDFVDIKKSTRTKLTELLGSTFRIGGIVSDSDEEEGIQAIKNYYTEKGYLDANVKMTRVDNPTKENTIILKVEVAKNGRVKIDNIVFEGNKSFSDRKLRRRLKGTKKRGTLFKKSKYIEEKFEEDKQNLIAFYQRNGYSDATITKDSIYRDADGSVNIQISIDEGPQYKYGNIAWKGNTLYTDEQLGAVLGILPGEVINPEELQKRISFSQDGRDVSSLYMDKGYLFFNIEPTQIAIRKDTIDMEMRIYEGPQATIDRVIIKGNDRTNEHVIRRVLRTRPGEKFSRSQIVRSQREIMNLGYFDPEGTDIGTPVNYERGTVDIVYTVVETPSDQLELSAGYGAFNGLIGTLGVTFNNFSIQNVRDRSAWSPLPTGDGQRFSVRLQSNGRFFRSYNVSFTEPWLGGKKPNALSVGFASNTSDFSLSNGGKISITNLFAGLGTSLKWPDDFFTSSTTLGFKILNLDNYSGFSVSDGAYKDFYINQVFSRSSVASPLYPMGGSRVSLSIQFTPPYSLFRGKNYWKIDGEEREQLVQSEIAKIGRRAAENFDQAAFIEQAEESRKFEFLEYHKWRIDAEWYYNIVDKLVFMTSAKLGYLGRYNNDIGDIPFERFMVGGDGLSNQNVGIQGTDIIALRGYEAQDINPRNVNNRAGGSIIFNKFTAELRYPLSTNPNSTIYGALFMQAGNQWDSFSDYNPFDLKRSVGAGLRVFLPMFGLLGFDYGFGLDKTISGNPNPSFGQLGKFSIVLGFEPD